MRRRGDIFQFQHRLPALHFLLVGVSGVGFLKGGEAVFEFPEKSLLFWMTDPWEGFRATDGWLLSQFFHRPTEKVFSRYSRISSLACFPEMGKEHQHSSSINS